MAKYMPIGGGYKGGPAKILYEVLNDNSESVDRFYLGLRTGRSRLSEICGGGHHLPCSCCIFHL